MSENDLEIAVVGKDEASGVFKGIAAGAGAAAGEAGGHMRELGAHAAEAGHGAEEAGGHFAHLRESLSEVGKIAAGMVAGEVLSGLTKGLGEQFTEVIGQTSQFGEQVRVLSQNMGISAQEASTLVFGMGELNINADAGNQAFIRFAKGLQGVNDQTAGTVAGGKTTLQVMKDLGVQTSDTGGKQRDFMAILGDVADKFKDMPDGIEKTARASQLFGRTAGPDMIPLLNLGKEGIEELSGEAKKYGLQLTGENVTAIRNFSLAHKEMDAAVEGARLSIGVALMPVLTALTKGLGDAVAAVVPMVREFLTTADLGAKLGPVLRVVGDVLGTIGHAVAALAKGDANSFFLTLSQEASNLGLGFKTTHDALAAFTNFLFGTVPQTVAAATTALKAFGSEALGRVQTAITDLAPTGERLGKLFDTIRAAVAGLVPEPLQGLVARLGAFSGGAGKGVDAAGLLGNALDAVVAIINGLSDAIVEATGFLNDHKALESLLVGVLTGAVVVWGAMTVATIAHTAATALMTTATGLMTTAQGALNVVMAANPIGLVIVAIAALAAGLVYAYKTSDTFRATVDGAFAAVKATLSDLGAFWGAQFSGFGASLRTLQGDAQSILGAVGGFFSALGATVQGVMAGILGAISGVLGAVSGLANAISNIPHPNISLPSLPGRAAGGSVLAGQAYIVGEQRPELFVPSSSGTILPSVPGGGGVATINVHVHGDVLQEGSAFARQVARVLAPELGRTLTSRR